MGPGSAARNGDCQARVTATHERENQLCALFTPEHEIWGYGDAAA